jgi:uncharacterized phiE125 gp8 family phage protein
MWYPAKITVAAANEPITLDEVKAQGIVDHSDDNAILGRLIKAARDHVEHYCGVRFASQTIEAKCDCFADLCRLRESPVSSLTSISYVDVAGATQTVAATVYELRADGLEASITLRYGQAWPTIQPGSRITLTVVVGYESAPEAVRHAMLMLVATWYAQRENILVGATVENLPMPSSVDALLCNFRRGV